MTAIGWQGMAASGRLLQYSQCGHIAAVGLRPDDPMAAIGFLAGKRAVGHDLLVKWPKAMPASDCLLPHRFHEPLPEPEVD